MSMATAATTLNGDRLGSEVKLGYSEEGSICESPRPGTPDSSVSGLQRSDSQYVVSAPVSSHVFLISFYEQILKSKSVNRFPDLKEITKRALDLAKTEGFCRERAQLPHNIEVILQPMLTCCQTGSQTLTLIGLDGLSKLITYDYLSNQTVILSSKDGTKDRSPIEKAVLAICGCFKGEVTEDKVQTQIIKGLMAAVSSSTTVIHQEALLNAIRTLYNIFLLSRDLSNQTIAQGTLVQMSRSVFSRIEIPEPNRNSKSSKAYQNGSFETNNSTSFRQESEYDSDEETFPKSEAAVDEKLSLEALGGKAAEAAANAQAQGNICDSSSDLNVLDGFLLFRALCKLSIKPYQGDSSLDVRSMSLRSKLLALYLILIIVTEFPKVFTTSKVYFISNNPSDITKQVREATFLTAVKPYFGLCLTRNLVATLPKIYELALGIFESVTENMRAPLKREMEVYLKEIIIPILELKPVGNQRQKHVLITMFLSKLCNDPQMLVEIYLNYDCGRGTLNNNIFEHLTGAISKLVTSIQSGEDYQQLVWEEADGFQLNAKLLNREDLMKLPTLTSDRFTSNYIARSFFSRVTFTDAILQYRAMDCLTGILRALVKWSNLGQAIADGTIEEVGNGVGNGVGSVVRSSSIETLPGNGINALQKGIETFNRKPKKGIEMLIQSGVIETSSEKDIAKFLLDSPDLDKHRIGEFLGEADAQNVAILHSFVDQLDFTGLEFVNAMRRFLQTFRLPGEAQKIDRFMLKFAERYTTLNPDQFANADTAYVLGYSVIMLNTDLHHPQVKRRMSKREFIKNNQGIDGGSDLAEEILSEIYDQISTVAIQLKDDPHQPSVPASRGKETSLPIQTNAEKYLKRLLSRKAHRDEVGGMAIFYSASHFEHALPMFEVCWMACLAAMSELLKNQENNKIIALCLDGFRNAIHIAGLFDLDLARNAFVTSLGNFCFLSNIREMKPKNLEAVRAMLDIAVDEGNHLKATWNDVLQIVNHLVRMQLVPNFSATSNGPDRSLVAHRDPNTRGYNPPLAMAESNTQSMLIAVDKVFAYSVRLSGPAIVDFIRALANIALEELAELNHPLDPSKLQSSPKMFSIQKVVEVAYYNMNRIRLEWREIWAVLGPIFNQLGCHRNETISSFVVDSLRQLASKFLDCEELDHFQFQNEFLRPFVHIIKINPSFVIKDMVLQCLQQMIQTNAKYLQSGWKALLEALGGVAFDDEDELVLRAFNMAKYLGANHFELFAVQPGNFKAYLICLAQFAKNPLLHKASIQAVEAFRLASDQMIEYSKSHWGELLNHEGNSKSLLVFYEVGYWVPIFHGLMAMVLEVKDLEIRTRAMDHLFGYLHTYGNNFSDEFWNQLLSDILLPLFSSLGHPGAKEKVVGLSATRGDEAAVWVSTTLVHALRKFVNLFTEFFDKVFQFLAGLLDLLSVCLCQDDPTLCKVGADCLKILVEENVSRMSEMDWQRVISIIIRLFKASSRVSSEEDASLVSLTIADRAKTRTLIKGLDHPESLPLPIMPETASQQLNLCLTVISLVEEVFLQNDVVFSRLDSDHIFMILDLVERAYLETQRINASFDVADAIQNQSVTKLEKFAATSLNLETNCLVCLIKVLLKMYITDDNEYVPYIKDIEARLIPLCGDSFRQFNSLSEFPLVPGVKSIYSLWHQVVLRVGNFLCKATGPEFKTVFGPISSEVIKALRHNHLSHDVQTMLFNVMVRVDSLYVHGDTRSLSPVEEQSEMLSTDDFQ